MQANDYYGGSASPNRAMLLNDVVMGKGIKLTTNNESLTQVRRCLSPSTAFRTSAATVGV